jgi:DNA ligase D
MSPARRKPPGKPNSAHSGTPEAGESDKFDTAKVDTDNGEPIEFDAAGTTVRVTSPNKIFFPALGATKLDLVEYYASVAGPALAALGGRPTMMERYPDGAAGKSFFQKRVPNGAPPWLQTTIVSTPNGTESNALIVADLAHLLWAVNIGCLGFHPWPYLAATPHRTDELRIDLDPQPGVTFDMVREAASEVRSLFDELQVACFPKTTGNRGIHVYVRLTPTQNSFAVRSMAVSLARELERRRPDLITAAWWKEERGTRVFVDFNQNAPHKTVFGAWAVRPRVGGQVSTPFRWDELATIDPETLTIPVVAARVATDGDPWAEMHATPQQPGALQALVEADAERGLQDAPWPPVYPKMPNEPSRVAPSRAKKPPADS